ncbi:hypothetical protein GCM10027032_04470 [Simplicispira piscis]
MYWADQKTEHTVNSARHREIKLLAFHRQAIAPDHISDHLHVVNKGGGHRQNGPCNKKSKIPAVPGKCM